MGVTPPKTSHRAKANIAEYNAATSAMDLESSFELLRRAKSGDAPALDLLLERYRPRLHRWCTGRLPRYARDFTDTEDVVQEALVGLVRTFDTFDYRGEWSVQAYLRRAATNRIRDEIRRHNTRPSAAELPEDAPSPDLSPLEQAMGREAFARYQSALDVLTDAEREAVIARVELGCSHAEVMVLVDKPTPDAARVFVARALEKLARDMAAKTVTG
jgi:RNA polymerase sigma-70 factor, ECF subfamily